MFAAKRAFKDKTLVDVVKLYLGLIIFSLPVAIFVIFTAAWLLNGEYSAWSQPYRYESGSRNSCSGAEVYEPELKRDPHLLSSGILFNRWHPVRGKAE